MWNHIASSTGVEVNNAIVPSPIVKIPNEITSFNTASVNLLEPSQYADVLKTSPPLSPLV